LLLLSAVVPQLTKPVKLLMMFIFLLPVHIKTKKKIIQKDMMTGNPDTATNIMTTAI
jgi:hypothetical protein